MGFPNYNNRGGFDIKMSDDKFYDLFISSDNQSFSSPLSGCCDYNSDLICEINFNDSSIYSTTGITSSDTIYSTATWTGATNTGYTLTNAGLLCYDFGLLDFIKTNTGDTQNWELVSALTGTTYVINSANTSQFFTRVSGFTQNISYPISIVNNGISGNVAKLSGGWYNGFSQLQGYTYKVAPERFNDGFTFSIWLNPDNSVLSANTSGSTIVNDIYPENSGFFFYSGCRSEIKYANVFTGSSSGDSWSACTSGCSQWCTVPKEDDVFIDGYKLAPPRLFLTEQTNSFTFLGRADGQLTACEYTGQSIVQSAYTTTNEDVNYFLTLGRQTTGMTACDLPHDKEVLTFNQNEDLIDNAIGFRITTGNSIHVKYISYSCCTVIDGCSTGDTTTTGLTINNFYTEDDIITPLEWNNVVIRLLYPYYDDCQLTYMPKRYGKLMIYVNSKLKHVIKDFPEIFPKPMADSKDKVLFTPYTMAIGGGAIGLMEQLTFDGPNPFNENLTMEKEFAGSFIGYINDFKLYKSRTSYCKIKSDFEDLADDYNLILSCPC